MHIAHAYSYDIHYSHKPIIQNQTNRTQSNSFSLYKRQQDYINAWKQAQSQANYGNSPNYAYATGAYTPNGIYQTAGVYPPNKVSLIPF